MKIKLLILINLLMFCTYAAENGTVTQDSGSVPYDWFLTHVALPKSMIQCVASVTKFDPVVRIYDESTNNLIVSLQRLTLEGKNTNLSDEGVTVELSREIDEKHSLYGKNIINIDDELVTNFVYVLDNGRKIMALEYNSKNTRLVSYNLQGKKDLTLPACSQVIRSVIRLSPCDMYVKNQQQRSLDDFFKKLQIQAADKNR